MEFSEKIAQIRQAHDLTQEKFAEICGIPYGSLRHYEKGRRKPPADVIQKIINAFPSASTLFSSTSKIDSEFISLIDDMTEEQLDQMIAYAKFLHSQRDK